MATNNNHYALGFLCADGHTSIISGPIYQDYDQAAEAQKKAQLNHKHRIEIVRV